MSRFNVFQKNIFWERDGLMKSLKYWLVSFRRSVVTIAKPTSAFLRAGPSLVPSPVTATTCRVSPTVLSIMPDRKHTLSVNHFNESTNEQVQTRWTKTQECTSLEKKANYNIHKKQTRLSIYPEIMIVSRHKTMMLFCDNFHYFHSLRVNASK